MNAIELYYAGREQLDNAFYAEALPLFEESLKLQPHFKSCECAYRCYAALNQPEKAFESISAAFALNAKQDKVALEYAKAIVNYKQDVAAAREVLLGILNRNPSYKPVKVMLNELGG
ncbi:MAG: hypothetical protein K2N06_12175 [Oscillospiraceae bacterium]|nr:hypothetical protein [Oscillospiraceae bacterium]